MIERRQLSQNSCQVSIFMDENLLRRETFSCAYSPLQAKTLETTTTVYVGDQSSAYRWKAYGVHGSTRFVLL